ncbi:bifunctional folylpolyglutamate synthase/dihydrofolate synthase [Alicyclobacillus cycloheptanicus]|uniref:tetrahydrofolate synthase n=1 Tax=Alicyclobacillus cycloheptanicus TaxID=1457 RepID=A0ABT9XDT6_9BACL|nr:folylpolyglutamate synthase/dihydrofolate synthase family protein [Alicyclobacillus cycloheptanicus]MDQ0188300.1 dihydrofolate synthase/folylpolyglutamate synthase [Alicyclobacillus cycloheptanicus]WDM01016.1 bifunctional folylpolyglutamate synthase/dihydrofolate synthase [Alicyclobacillus cycloheptanicus]
MAVAAQTDGFAWLTSLARFGIKPGLARTQAVLAAFGHPERSLRFLHVAGTNGKGSVCAFLTALLSASATVGTYTSPAFSGYRGRFVVDGASPTDDVVNRLACEVQAVAEAVVPDDPLTEFEALTVMAVLYFARSSVDYVVWETGLGGRYDATNVVTPIVSAITNVGRDHMEILGDTLRKVAYDKAGIIKPGIPVVTAARDEGAMVVAEVARAQGAPAYHLGRHFSAVRTHVDASGQTLSYRGVHRDFMNLQIPLFGEHQCENAAVALAMYELAAAREPGSATRPLCTARAQVSAALAKTRWPGRFEVFEVNGQPVILDGAHNPEGAGRFRQALVEWSALSGVPESSWTMVIGVLNDKDVTPMLGMLLPYARHVIVTAPSTPRAKRIDLLAKAVEKCRPGVNVECCEPVSEAVARALALGGPICCWGSLYTVDEARRWASDAAQR